MIQEIFFVLFHSVIAGIVLIIPYLLWGMNWFLVFLCIAIGSIQHNIAKLLMEKNDG